jgi:hypothetical protein
MTTMTTMTAMTTVAARSARSARTTSAAASIRGRRRGLRRPGAQLVDIDQRSGVFAVGHPTRRLLVRIWTALTLLLLIHQAASGLFETIIGHGVSPPCEVRMVRARNR